MSIATPIHHKSIRFRPVGSDKTFNVKIPHEICELIDATDDKERLRVGDSWLSCLKKLDVQLARNDLECLERLLRISKENFLVQPTGMIPLSRAVIPPGPNSRGDVLWLLQFDTFRDLTGVISRTLLRNACEQAILHKDLQFFIQLGRRLTQKSKRCGAIVPRKKGDGLRHLIALHWIDLVGGDLDFCHFTDSALCDFLRIVRADLAPTLEAVRITRKRELKLVQAKRLAIRTVKTQGDVIVLG